MDKQAYNITSENSCAVVCFIGYCSNETIETLPAEFSLLCDKNVSRYILDFSACPIVNSLGIATILEALLIIKDYDGQVVITGLDALKTRFFTLTGIFSLADQAENMGEAKQMLDFPEKIV